jgi:hypothetical protein
VTEPAQTKPFTHWRQAHKRLNAHLLFAEDIGPVGTKVDIEIASAVLEDVKGEDGTTKMPILTFAAPAKKRFGLNVGNSKTMETLCGTPNVNEWGGWITLVVFRRSYYDQKTRQTQETDAILIANKRPEPKKAKAAQP